MHTDRRTVLAGLSAAAVAGTARAADFAVPDGACDCHHHIYDPRFPYAKNAMLKPPPATVADYRRQVQKPLGVTRNIAVTPSTYATDNACLVDALGQFGVNARGVAVVHADVAQAELKRLHDAGVRGVRIQFGRGPIVGSEEIMPLAKHVAPLGWHMQFNLTGPKDYLSLADTFQALPCTLVFDHLAHQAMPLDRNSAHYKLMRRLLDSGHSWMKLSSPYTDSKIGPPAYPDVSVLARDYAAHNPERMLWASNWPFPDIGGKGDPLAFLNILQNWVPDAAVRHRILVENPEKLYGFDPAKRPKARG